MTKPTNLSFTPLGAIFDVDDTLLDNYPSHLDMGLHEQARFLAIKEVGNKYGIAELIETTHEQNRDVIRRAQEHSIEGSIWQLLYELGLVDSSDIDRDNTLLKEIAERKHELYEPVMLEFGAPIPKAIEFVQAMYLLTHGNIAIASGAQRSSVLIFLQTTGLDAYFLPERIFAKEDVACSKPDPLGFNLAFESLGLAKTDRRQVIAFEDDPKGVLSAGRAGLYTCAITTRFKQGDLETMELAPDMVRDSYIAFAEAFDIMI